MSSVHSQINTDMPFALQPSAPSAGGTSNRLSAIYIPTRSCRKHLGTDVQTLLQFSNRVILLCSGGQPPWGPENNTNSRYTSILNMSGALAFEQFLSRPSSRNPSLCVTSSYDLPYKRNFALHHARNSGFRYIGLLDDDIVLSATDIAASIDALAQGGGIVGFHILDYPDISALDHVRRLVLRKPARVSMGGNCIFFDSTQVYGFFPYIYNEDWLFLMTNYERHVNVRSMGVAHQFGHKPWRDLQRVQFEQFGDVLVTGGKASIKNNRAFLRRGPDYWEEIIRSYTVSLQELLYTCPANSEWSEATIEGIRQVERFSAEDFVRFIDTFTSEVEAEYGSD